jgi:uncharacterized membrane protein YhhN
MSFTFIWIALIIAVLDWIAVAKKWKPLEYIAKPAVMIALLVWVWQAGGFKGHMVWFALGLVFSLFGDIFLMLPQEQFIAGLISFLLAHIAYLIGFLATIPPLNIVSLILAVLVGITAARIYRTIAASLVASGDQALRPPVLIYTVVISSMLWSALMTLVGREWLAIQALLAAGGALLFFLSDTFLAWNKFVSPIRHGNLLVIITYHLGQVMIILGAGLHYIPIN